MGSNLDSMFKSDTSSELEGIWLEISDTVRFRVKRFGGKNAGSVKMAMAKYYKPFALVLEKGLLAEEKEREIYTKVFVEASLLGWEGVELDGESAPFTFENAIKLLGDLPDLTETLIAYASDVKNYAIDVGNS